MKSTTYKNRLFQPFPTSHNLFRYPSHNSTPSLFDNIFRRTSHSCLDNRSFAGRKQTLPEDLLVTGDTRSFHRNSTRLAFG
uniref:Uncharacterized protein n=1 Tax=Helianthus annuus TaxID=4232 RepID=A0A251TEV2_HELAN